MNPYNDYCEFTGTVAIYPQHVAAEYLGLGLCSEAAECVEIILTRKPYQSIANNLGGELGDVQWYTARLAYTYGFDFGEIVFEAKKTYKPNYEPIEDTMSKVTVVSGLIAGKIKKQLRDGDTWNGEQREDVRQYVRQQLVQVVLLSMRATDWLFANHGDEYSSYDKLLKMNRKKLESRKERGTIRGEGSHR